MNSTLPSFPMTPAAPAAGASLLNSATLGGPVPGAVATPAGEGSAPGAPPDFAALMTPASPVAPAAVNASMPTATAIAVTSAVVTVSVPTVAALAKPFAWSLDALASHGASLVSDGAAIPAAISTAVTPPGLPEASPVPAEVPAELREQAVAFATVLLQTLLPEATAPQPQGTQPEGPKCAGNPLGYLCMENEGPGRSQLARAAIDAADTNAAQAADPVWASPQSTVLDGQRSSLSLAADGAVELKLELPKLGGPNSGKAPEGESVIAGVRATETDRTVGITAELELPGQVVVRFEATGQAAMIPQPENFAGKKPREMTGVAGANEVAERNFESTGVKQVKPRSPKAGIAVAQAEANMPAAPTEEIRATRSPQDSLVSSTRVEFQVAQTPMERITMPAPGPAGQTSFAERAVETVTGLVETQFAASMQKSGSVHLRLKFGGEDLSVRVAIRDGEIHTDFRTDSAPLRAAIEREWQAVVAGSAGQMTRYAEPVFAPAHAGSSFLSGQSGDPRQQAQQQQAQPDAQQHRSPREFADSSSPFSRRSLVGESFVPEAPASRLAAFLPTSRRLSALA